MKKTLSILIVVFVVILVVGGVWLVSAFLRPATSNTQTPYTNPYSYSNNTSSVSPTSSSTNPVSSGATIKIILPSGKSLVVKDFIHNHETVADRVNPGYYFMAGSLGYCLGDGTCPSGYKTDDFSITYHDSNGHFNIALLTEPLAKSRAEAEVFMLDRLGVAEAQLCNIDYWIGTTKQVNALYAGKNLGFDFCPGAVQL